MTKTLAYPIARPGFIQRSVEHALAEGGIHIGGAQPWDITVHDAGFFRRAFLEGSLGLGESYVDGWWDCAALDEFFARLLRSHVDERRWSPRDWLQGLYATLFNRQTVSRSRQVAYRHYDLDPSLYRAMLGDELVYSCGYWREAATLEAAQVAKIDLVCRKLGLRAGMRVCDIGCGWGAAAVHAASQYGVQVVGLTISHEQAVAARQRCRNLPIDIREQDYRGLDERFDRIFSIGMFEHVGHHNYSTYMRTVRRCLNDDGLFLLHTIGADRSSEAVDSWLDRYIFPNATIPSARWLTAATEGVFVIEDWHPFGAYYDRTLMAWHQRLSAAWESLSASYDEAKRRLWKYYLLSCAGSFRARKNQVWQVVLSPHGVPGGYCPVR